MPSVDQVRTALEIAERYAVQYGVPISASVPIPPCLIDSQDFPHVGMAYCPVGTSRAYWTIDPMGNVRPCNHSTTVLGNILDQPFRQIVRSPKLFEFVQAHPSSCSTCEMLCQCHGGCRAAAQQCYGSPTARDPFLGVNAMPSEAGVEAEG